jgi:hypothetical protein
MPVPGIMLPNYEYFITLTDFFSQEVPVPESLTCITLLNKLNFVYFTCSIATKQSIN